MIIPVTPALSKITRYRTIWISDVHLGTRQCRADRLLAFLRTHHADTFYLVGDIIDFWKLSNGGVWTDEHDQVIEALMAKARDGARVVYLPGNHDGFMRRFLHYRFADMEIMDREIHVTAQGRRLLVVHGDFADESHEKSRVRQLVFDALYETANMTNRVINNFRARRNQAYWSFHHWLRTKLPPVRRYIERYEAAVCSHVAEENVCGVVCGHIHQSRVHERNGVLYYNTGDWVDTCTALVEFQDGTMSIVEHANCSDAHYAPRRLPAWSAISSASTPV